MPTLFTRINIFEHSSYIVESLKLRKCTDLFRFVEEWEASCVEVEDFMPLFFDFVRIPSGQSDRTVHTERVGCVFHYFV